MTTEEKIYLRRTIASYYYEGQIDEMLDKLCTMAGWMPLEAGGWMPEEQQNEITFYLNKKPRRFVK